MSFDFSVGGLDSPTVLLLAAFTAVVIPFAIWAVKRNVKKRVYSAKRIVNQSEGKLYVALERWRRENAKELNLSTQVSYGAFIGAKKHEDWRAIASKHADFVFWGRDGYVRAIIEFDGEGHYGDSKDAADKVRQRDEIKNAAAISANIPLIRIPASASNDDIVEALGTVLRPKREPIVVKAPADNVAHMKI